MRRLLTTATVAVALTIPAVATLGFGGVAGAKTVVPTPGSSVACTKIVFNLTANTASLSKCYGSTGAPVAKAFKTLNASSATGLVAGGMLTWAPGPSGGATVTNSALTSETPTGVCAKKDTQAQYSGTITAETGTGNPVSSAAGDNTVFIDVCLATAKSGAVKVTFAKGTVAEL
jgi:hypothetical protein